jgi:ornithine cyclodeaminase
MKIITLDQIKDTLPIIDLLPAIEEGFVAYSAGQTTVPPVGEMMLEKGEVHIKYGYIHDEEYYVIKIASGFYDNHKLGLPTGNGVMLLFSQHTGEPKCILADEGYLTDVRTAVAGAICAKHLAPKNIHRIGIVGAGVQGRMQLEYLLSLTSCRDVLVWGQHNGELARYKDDMTPFGFNIETTLNTSEIMKTCNLIVTATPAKKPLLDSADLNPGVHITAMGSDTPHKQELAGGILGMADLVVADSISQCLVRGEIHKAIQGGFLSQDKVVELGDILSSKVNGRENDEQITIADLTGVAVQDIQIASAVYSALS